jgi:hypothetical protein
MTDTFTSDAAGLREAAAERAASLPVPVIDEVSESDLPAPLQHSAIGAWLPRKSRLNNKHLRTSSREI